MSIIPEQYSQPAGRDYYTHGKRLDTDNFTYKVLIAKDKINSRPDSVPTLWEAYINLNITTCHSEVDDTEPKAIIKICEWILKEKICL